MPARTPAIVNREKRGWNWFPGSTRSSAVDDLQGRDVDDIDHVVVAELMLVVRSRSSTANTARSSSLALSGRRPGV
jgi:hypothetical protein